MKRKRVQWRERRKNYEKTIDMISKYREDINHEKKYAANVSAPTSMSEYEIGGRKYIVVSHYVGNKDFKKVFDDLAFSQVLADMQKSVR